MSGLVIGKFLPVHKGHLALIDWAAKQCDLLNVVVCANDQEMISGKKRLKWVEKCLAKRSNLKVSLFEYNEALLLNTSESSHSVSEIWVKELKKLFPETKTIFTSEPNGEYVAEIWGVKHQAFDLKRKHVPVSSSQIFKKPFLYWEYIPVPVRPHFIKKVCLVGTQSTGKSVLAEKLANYYNTTFVDEVGREVIPATEDSTMELLHKIAIEHAKKIIEKTREANKLLFIDTDLIITKSYADFLFNEELIEEDWIEEANHCHLYLYSSREAPFLQDGTRLNEEERNQMDKSHLKAFKKAGVKLHFLTGSWEERFEQAIKLVDKLINSAYVHPPGEKEY